MKYQNHYISTIPHSFLQHPWLAVMGVIFFLQPLLLLAITFDFQGDACISHLVNYLLCSSSCLLVEKPINFINMKGSSVEEKQSSALQGKSTESFLGARKRLWIFTYQCLFSKQIGWSTCPKLSEISKKVDSLCYHDMKGSPVQQNPIRERSKKSSKANYVKDGD